MYIILYIDHLLKLIVFCVGRSKELAMLYESYSTAAAWFCALQVKNTML